MSTINEKFSMLSGINEPFADEILKRNEYAVWHLPSGTAKDAEGRTELIEEINADEDIKSTLAINPTPSDAKVVMNGEETKSLKVINGTEVSYTVSKEGYTEKSGKETVNETKTVDVQLDIIKLNVTVNTEPAEATVKFNDGDVDPDKQIEVDYGQTVKYTVEATGYDSKTETSEAITETKTISVTLNKTKCTLTVNATPEGCTVKLGTEEGTLEEKISIEVDYGTTVYYEVSKPDTHSPKSGNVSVTEKSQTLEVTLDPVSEASSLSVE